jgi:cyclohexanone monooxygenase
MQTNGFPNLFLLSMVQAGISINYLHTADAQSKYIADLVLHCLQNEIGSVEPTEEAVNEWVGLCLEFSGPRRKFQESCTPSYLNFEGNRPKELDLNAPFGGGPLKYFEQLDAMKRERFATRMLFEARETR